MSKVVKTGEVTVAYWIKEHSVLGVTKYDWHTNSGAESDEWFQSVEDAVRDIEEYF